MPKVNLCFLVQARVPVDMPGELIGATPRERLAWANKEMTEIYDHEREIIFRSVETLLDEDDSPTVSMIEMEQPGDDYVVLAMTRDWEVWWDLDKAKEIIPTEGLAPGW